MHYPRRVPLFGFELDAVALDEAVARVYSWLREPGSACRYVVTPNVDHAVLYQRHAGLRAAYADASLVLADGMPVVATARLLGRPIPERVTGTDLTVSLLARADEFGGCRVFLLGASPEAAARAAELIVAQWPAVTVVGTNSPPRGFENDPAESERILDHIERASPDLLVVGLGAPKQELWVHAHHQRIRAAVALCVGAAIDFLGGAKKRAPEWMQQYGLEWLHRLASEPRRLGPRYARDAWHLPGLVGRELLQSRLRRW
ncbi:MAG: WecB/TagA/CpsF family glycosyltransferase [Pirellulales bacterium]